MCGIAGMFGSGPHAAVDRMTRRLDHRGPDGLGVVHLGHARLGATRLSLIDEAHGHQPFRSDDGRLALAYNGEVYNHAELRAALEARGLTFRGRCDTEVVLRSFGADAAASVESFEGMFAFALTDGDTLWLARDAFGIKPLYYALLDDGRRLVFASELKSMLADPSMPRTLDRAALFDQAVFGHYLAGKTPFAAIREVPPSSVLTCDRAPDGELRLRWDVHSKPRRLEPPENEVEAGARVVAELRASVHAQCEADHPVGSYLSGGLDSSLLVALMAERGGTIHTFATADRRDHPDLRMARALAAALGTRHHERVVTAHELLDALPRSIVDLEGMGPPSIAELAAPGVRGHVKAALCGDGADELFAGYAMHAFPGRWLALFAQRYNHLVRGGEILETDVTDAWATLGELSGDTDPPDRAELMDRFHAFYLGSQLTVAHLRRWDAGTMAHGLELRVPFLSRPLRDLALGLPWSLRLRGRATKVALRAAAGAVLPADLLTPILERPKLAAPNAYRRGADVLGRFLARQLPPSWRDDEHPFRPFYRRPIERYLLDLFVLLFVGRGGAPADGLRATELYSSHSNELREALERAQTPLPASCRTPRGAGSEISRRELVTPGN